MKHICLALLAAFSLSACATAIPRTEMQPNPNIYVFLDNKNLNNNVSVGNVSLSSAMPTMGIIVTKEEFKGALEIGITKAGWQSKPAKPAGYTLSANFVDQDIPFTLFNSKVFSIVDYTLINNKTGNVAYHQKVTIPCVVTLAQVFDAQMRELQARKCSVSENITHVLRDINNKI
jgi:hypothetical protein